MLTLYLSASPALPAWSSYDFEMALREWKIPSIMSGMSSFQELAVRTAWETLRKASLVFLWRGCGLHSNLLEPMRADRKEQTEDYVNEIIINVRILVELGRSHSLSIGNAMLWPIAVVGCECLDTTRGRREDVIQLLDDIGQLYTMDHTARLKEILNRLWQGPFPSSTEYLSLEQTCTEMQLIVPLI